MRWLTFTIFAYVFAAADAGLANLLQIGGVRPNLLLILGVFIGLSAAPMSLAWAMLVLGVLADIVNSPLAGVGATVLGPSALGFLFGGWAMLQFRGLVFRQSAIAMGVLVFLTGIFVHLVIVATVSMRGMAWPVGEPVPGWSATDQLVHRFMELIYTAILAVPLGAILIHFEQWWGFGHGKHRAY